MMRTLLVPRPRSSRAQSGALGALAALATSLVFLRQYASSARLARTPAGLRLVRANFWDRTLGRKEFPVLAQRAARSGPVGCPKRPPRIGSGMAARGEWLLDPDRPQPSSLECDS